MEYEQLAAEILDCVQRAEPLKAFDVGMCGETFILRYVDEHQSASVTPSQISGAMNVSSARIAAALNTLEKKGLVVRTFDKNDRRKTLVSLTEEGRAAAQKQKLSVLQKISYTLRLLGERDAEDFMRITRKLAEIPNIFSP